MQLGHTRYQDCQHETRPFAACAKHFLTSQFPCPALSLIPCFCLGVLAPGPAYAISLCVQASVGAWVVAGGRRRRPSRPRYIVGRWAVVGMGMGMGVGSFA